MKFLRLSILFLLFIQFYGCDFSDDTSEGDSVFNGGSEKQNSELVIAYAEAPVTYSPLTYDSASRKYINNIYEPLLSYDKSFNFKTALAVSWGRIDDLTWDFKLRDGVLFHDGTPFDADDAVYSLRRAMDTESGLHSLLENIESVQRVEKLRFRIITKDPDPLLLHKLTNVLIFKYDYVDFDSPLGTGPYVFSGFNDWDMEMLRFDEYWGPAPFYEKLVLSYIPDPDERKSAAVRGDTDFLANVPPQYVGQISSAGFDIIEVPSLEVSFLMFNTAGVFGDGDLRNAAWRVISNDYAEKFGDGYLDSTNQYAATGIFGFIPDIEERSVDFGEAYEYRENYRKKYSGPVEVTIDVPLGLETLGRAISLDLETIDIDADVNTLAPADLEQKIISGESDIYFFGWKYDLADVSDFYLSTVHSREGVYGAFNGIAYDDSLLDSMIEDVVSEFDEVKRRALFEDIFYELRDDKLIMPLFESSLLYAVSEDLTWDVRLDGQVLASEIFSFVVQ